MTSRCTCRVRSERLEGFIIRAPPHHSAGGGQNDAQRGAASVPASNGADVAGGVMERLETLSWEEKEIFYRGMAVTLAARFSRVFMEAVRIGRLKAMNDSQSVLQNLDETELICKQCACSESPHSRVGPCFRPHSLRQHCQHAPTSAVASSFRSRASVMVLLRPIGPLVQTRRALGDDGAHGDP